MKYILGVCFVTLSLLAMPKKLTQMLRVSGIPSSDISIYIKEAGESNRIIASLNASKPRTPASVIKVLSVYAAVLKLGFDYRWPTKFYAAGIIRRGVLKGDLVVKGFGDPTLSTRDLPGIVAQIKAKGIRRITGNIVIDRTYFNVGSKDNSGFDRHTYSPYNAMPDAMMFNERISTICVTPRRNSVSKAIPDESYRIINTLKPVNKPCRGRYSWPSFKIDKSQELTTVLLRGPISKRCGTRKLCQVITKPYQSFYYALKDVLQKNGIVVDGGFRLNTVPPHARALFTHYAKPLEKIVSKTAKKSNNLYARHLMLYLGAQMYGAPATLKKGRDAVEYILKRRGALQGGTLHLDNGCGLSRTSKITAKLLAGVLDHAYRKYGQRWMNILSIAGVDGTIKRRFRGTIVRNRAWMKTGTLKRVKNIAGYVKSRNGRFYTVVILVNSKAGNWKASQLQNNIIKGMVRYKGRGKVSVQKAFDQLPHQEGHRGGICKEGRRGYYVQVASFSRYPSSAYLSKVSSSGFPYCVKNDGEYKVLIGPYFSEVGARKSLGKIKSDINPDAFYFKNFSSE